jgi:hypothetical protein
MRQGGRRRPGRVAKLTKFRQDAHRAAAIDRLL